MLYFDPSSLLLVFGGTIAAVLLAFSTTHLAQVFDFVLFGVFRYKKTDYVTLIEEFADVQQAVAQGDDQIMFRGFSHPFLAESVALLMKRSLSLDETASLLQDRVFVFNRRYLQDAKILTSIAKYPPLFGLLGATSGLISMMTQMSGAGVSGAMGLNFAIALVSGFWGIALSSFVILPLADHAQKSFESDEFTRNFIKEGVLLIKSNVNRKYLIEKLASMLPIEQRTVARGQHAAVPNAHEQINVVEIFTNHKKRQLEVRQNAGVVNPVKKSTTTFNLPQKKPSENMGENVDPFFHAETQITTEPEKSEPEKTEISSEQTDAQVFKLKVSTRRKKPENLEELRKLYQKRSAR